MQIQAIETEYKGYRFRSRLEARWAVFFDALGTGWRYEEEGYSSGDEYYLPDFRLYRPAYTSPLITSEERPTNLFVEIKGDPEGLVREAGRNEQLHDWGGCLPGFSDCYGSSDGGLILLGSIPTPGESLTHFHPIIQHRKGLWRRWCFFVPSSCWGSCIEIVENHRLSALLDIEEDPMEAKEWLVECRSRKLDRYYPVVDRAYQAARSARFEHGEKGYASSNPE